MAAPNPFQNLIIGFTPGERIFTEGEVGTTMFIVQSGRVRLFRESGGKTVAIAEMEKGDFFGEMSLLEASARNMSAEAIEMVELIEINSTTFDRMIRSNIEIAVRMLRKLSGRLQRAESLLAMQRAERETAGQEAAAVPAAMVGAHAAGVPLKPSRPVPADLPSPLTRASAAAPAATRSAATAAPRPAATPGATPARKVASAAPLAAVPQGVSPPAASPQTTPTPSSFPRPTPAPAGSLSATRPPTPTGGAPLGPRAAPPLGPPARTPAVKGAPGHGPRLVSESGESVFPISAGEAIVGRYDPVTETQPEVDLTLIDIKRSVSRRHARISAREGSFYLVEEVGALNGTFINGVKLITGKPAPLNNEDRISLGTVNLVFRI